MTKEFQLPLRRLRKEQNLSQEAIADALQIKTTTYSKIERGLIQLTLPRLYKLADIFHLSPQALLTYGQPAQAEVISQKNYNNIIYIPVHAQAGFLDNYVDQRTLPDGIAFSLPTFSEKDLYMISVEGDSMYPTLAPGAFIIIKEARDHSLLQWGEPYLIVTTEGRVVKRLLKNKESSLLTLYSDNDLYQPYEIKRENILSLWKIIGMVSKSFNPSRIFSVKRE